VQRPRTPSRISDSLHQRLNSYALAASAAGVSMLALVQPAEAKIVYTRTHNVIDHLHHAYLLDLGRDKTADFAITYSFRSSYGLYEKRLAVGPGEKGNAVQAIRRRYSSIVYKSLAVALNPGGKIGSSNFRTPTVGGYMAQIFLGNSSRCGRKCYWGYWFNVTDKYLGLRFGINGTTHYGWARLKVQETNSHDLVAILTGYAYETIPNKPIIAGKTKGKDVVTVTEPASLGHLARGASAIPPRRGTN
jgi:hypothetical protein